MNNRTITLPGQWALDAPNVPGVGSPSVGTTYRNSAITQNIIETAWKYGVIVNSADFNEVMARITGLLALSETCGILPWCATTSYPVGAQALGSNGRCYVSRQADNTNHDPVSSPTYWVQNPNFGTDTGTTNAFVVTFPVPFTAHSAGAPISFVATHANTGACVINQSGLGNVAIKIQGTTDPPAGAIAANQLVMLAYDGTYYQLLNANVSTSGFWSNSNCPASVSGNGYQRFNTGWMFQFCSGAATTNETPYSVAFPTSFPHACFHVFLTTVTPQTDPYGIKNFELISVNASSCYLYLDQYNAAGGPWSPKIFAVGW